MSSIFMTVPRALHFAFLIQAYEVAPESIMAKIMRQNMKECEVWGPRPLKTVNFSGLSQVEVYVQCAALRAAVMRELPPLECAAVFARYALTEYEDVDGVRRWAFSKERAEAIMRLAEHCKTFLPDAPLEVLDLLVARAFVNKRQTPIHFTVIAEQHGKSREYWRRLAKRIDERLIGLENAALDTLTPLFTEEHRGESVV